MNKPYPDTNIDFDYALYNPQRFEKKPDITIEANSVPYLLTPFMDHYSDCYLFYMTSRDDTTIKPVHLKTITAEAVQDTALVEQMLIVAVSEYEST